MQPLNDCAYNPHDFKITATPAFHSAGEEQTIRVAAKKSKRQERISVPAINT